MSLEIMDAESGGGSRGSGADGKLAEPEDHQKNRYNHRHLHHYNHHYFFRQAGRVAVFWGLIAVTWFVLFRSGYRFQSLPHSASPSSGLEKLNEVMGKAAMESSKTVIITTLNEAWASPNSMLDLFLESFKIGNQTQNLLNHLVVIALDQKAYARCLTLHTHCYALTTSGKDFSSEAFFMTSSYLDMMWTRIDFLHSLLKLGYNFVFTDADIMWFRDPFSHFYADADFQIACDFFRGNPSDMRNRPNGGFNYVISNNRTIEFYKFWYNSRKTYPGLHDQDVLNKIKFDPFLKEIGIKIRFLDTVYFGGFCQPSEDLNRVCTMHANCCVGLDPKIHDLKVMLEDWRKYMSSSTEAKASRTTSWTVPQDCRNSFGHRKKNVHEGRNN